MKTTDFSSLKLSESLVKNIDTLGYSDMTPIQAESLPLILDGKDVIGQAKTGSGKTAAFGLGILSHLDVQNTRVQALVLCPTRELAEQVATSLRQLARQMANVKILTLCGGVMFRKQSTSLEYGAHIIVGTPGRICKHLRKRTLKLRSLKMLVLDEGDRMLEMGFQDELDAIIDEAPKQRQSLLFSATFPERIQELAERVMCEPEMVQVETAHDEESITQHFFKVANDTQRLKAVQLLIQEHQPESTVVFCNTKQDAMDVTDELIDLGYDALDLHGDLEQYDRDETLVRFANKSVSILVATDVAARGLDIDSLDLVINYHFSRDFEVHVHRIGRTGRAGNSGYACTLYTEREEYKLGQLAEFLAIAIEPEQLPDDSVLQLSKTTAPMTTLKLNVGKRQKIRPGNILGALTGETGLPGSDVGKIKVCDNWSYVAVACGSADFALEKIHSETWKNRPLKARLVESAPLKK